MTPDERQASVQRLIAVLQGDEAGAMITETGEIEPRPSRDLTRMDDLHAMMRLTSSDRRDRSALRTLRAQVLHEAPSCRITEMQRTPLDYLAELSWALHDHDDPSAPMIPDALRPWVEALQRLRQRICARWMDRVRYEARGDAITFGSLWMLLLWFEKDDR